MNTIDDMPDTLREQLDEAGRVPGPSDEAVAAALTVVRRAANTESLASKVRSRRRVRLRRSIAAATLCAAVAVGIGVVRLDDGSIAGPSPAAAAVLVRAGEVTLADGDLVVAPGQYLKVTRRQESPAPGGSDVEELTLWIPHEIDRPWAERYRELSRSGGAEAEPRVVTDETRRVDSWADAQGDSYRRSWDPRWYASLPSDPERLLDEIRATIGGDGSGSAYDFEEIFSEVLRSGTVPATVRASLFSALAEVDGLRVERAVEFDGTTATGIRADGGTMQMMFDTASGRFVGARYTAPDDPRRTQMTIVVTTTVVDTVPRL